MNLLLDTHVLLWALLEPQKLSPALRSALEDSDNTLVVSQKPWPDRLLSC